MQEKLFNEVVDAKQGNRQSEDPLPTPNFLLFCEHPHVYTLGKSGKESNLLINEEFLKSKGASLYRINRGGDITYHGPGQVVRSLIRGWGICRNGIWWPGQWGFPFIKPGLTMNPVTNISPA